MLRGSCAARFVSKYVSGMPALITAADRINQHSFNNQFPPFESDISQELVNVVAIKRRLLLTRQARLPAKGSLPKSTGEPRKY